MASHPGLELQPLTLESQEPNQQTSLEHELGPAVLDACSSLWREYAELSAMAPSAFPVCEQDLLDWYAELQFKTLGGSRCSLCGASVRHALKVRAERPDGSTRTYLCLCTRCLIAEEAVCGRVLFRVANQWVQARRQHGVSPRTRQSQAA
jgi:hypothetical protein